MDLSKYRSGAAALPPAAPGAPSTGYPTDGDPVGGVPATRPGAHWYYQVQAELTNILEKAGVVAAIGTLTQLWAALTTPRHVAAPMSNGSVPNNTWTTMSLSAPGADPDGLYSGGSPSRLTIPAGIAWARFIYTSSIQAHTVGYNALRLMKNGAPLASEIVQSWPNGSDTWIVKGVSRWLPVVAGDYFEIQQFQNSGGSIAYDSNGSLYVEYHA